MLHLGHGISRELITVSCSFSFGFRFDFMLLILFACGDIELNPGHENRNSCYNFSNCHWNLNSITAHNFAKVNLLQVCNAIHDFDLLCLSESYLDSAVSSDDDKIMSLKNHKSVRADPRNVKMAYL